MWRPSVVARELGEAATGLVIVVAGLVNPILCLVGVPLVAASTAAVMELSRSRTADLDRKTGLLNEPAFTYLATRELERAARTRAQVSLLMLDLDHLKRLNDTHGHLAGDVAIVGIAEQIAARMRSTDLACRFGGEEFTVLLPDTGLRGALALAERIRLDVARYPVAGRDGSPVPISVSIGVASWAPPSMLAELKQAADDALYEAKNGGRNRVMAAPVGIA
jgi:diguanylate cyclase (GGDEF)-like protein